MDSARNQYDEVAQYITLDPDKIKYPNRKALQIRNSPYMTQFDGAMFEDLKDQNDRMMKAQMRDLYIIQMAREQGRPAQVYNITDDDHDPHRACPWIK